MYLNSQKKIDDFCKKIHKHGHVAVDLEFIPENNYYPKLALIQLAVEDDLKLVDPLGGFDLTPIDDLMSNGEILKIVHAGSSDMGIFFHRTKKVPEMVFDTQVAGSFLGMGLQISYQAMVKELFDEHINKGQSYTNWLNRPLSNSQERYAIEDVKYLYAAYKKMYSKLEQKGRLEWVSHELKVFENLEFYETSNENAYKKVKKAKNLKGYARAIMVELATFREKLAKKKDLPRKRILADELLVEIAMVRPGSINAINKIRGINRIRRGLIPEILDIIQSVKEPEIQPAKPVLQVPLSKEQKLLVEFLFFCLKAFCEKEKIATSYVGNRADMESLVQDYYSGNFSINNHSVLNGWKYESIGKEIINCLEGKTSVSISPNTSTLEFNK